MVSEKFLEKPVLKSSLNSQSQTAVITNQHLQQEGFLNKLLELVIELSYSPLDWAKKP